VATQMILAQGWISFSFSAADTRFPDGTRYAILTMRSATFALVWILSLSCETPPTCLGMCTRISYEPWLVPNVFYLLAVCQLHRAPYEQRPVAVRVGEHRLSFDEFYFLCSADLGVATLSLRPRSAARRHVRVFTVLSAIKAADARRTHLQNVHGPFPQGSARAGELSLPRAAQ